MTRPLPELKLVFSDARKYRWARHSLFWEVWWLFFTLIYGSKPIGTEYMKWEYLKVSYAISAVEALLYLPIHMLFSYSLIYLLVPKFLLQGKYSLFSLGLITTILSSTFLSNYITDWLVTPFRRSLGFEAPFSNLFYGIMAGLRGGLQTGGFAVAIKLLKYYYLKQQANQQLAQEKLKAELQLLKSQLHPHFLFNTLNSLFSLTLTKSDQAPDVVLKLSGLLNYMLYECNTPQVALTKELQQINSYIELEKVRFGERVDVMVNFSGELEGKQIAPLLLLPFVENSFKHGVAEQLDQAWISLDVSVKGTILKLKLINSKSSHAQPFNPNTNHQARIGLANVRKRLDLIYPGQYELNILAEAETFLVSLTLPLQTALEAVTTETSGINQTLQSPISTKTHENPMPTSR